MHGFSSSPFHLLGIPPGSSQRDIKKAYRQKAKEVHPDKVPSDQREQASKAFRDLHEAYERAMDICINGSSSDAFTSNPSSSWKDTTTVSRMKKTFIDICKELDRELNECIDNRFKRCINEICNAWPDKELCWQIAKTDFGLSTDIDKLADVVYTSNPELSSYLSKRNAEDRRQRDEQWKENLRNNAKRVNEYWPRRKDELKEWVTSNDLLYWDWNEIADLVQNPEAGRNIQLWLKERMDQINLRRAKRIKASAEEIAQAFPDEGKIKSILSRCFFSDRQEIFDQLPDDIYKALRTQSWFSKLLE